MFKYFSFLLRPGNPCQGKLPLKKYINTCPIDSKSSLLLYSIDKLKSTDPLVGVETGVPGRASQAFAVLVGDVLPILLVLLGQAKVNYVHEVFGGAGGANQEIIRLDVSVQHFLLVNSPDPSNLNLS